MKIRLTRLCILLLLSFFIVSCMKLGPSTSRSTRFYLLESKTEAGVPMEPKDWFADISLGIGPVSIPAYLDRPQLVTRLSGNELQVDEFHQWAEPLRANITRVIAKNLSTLTGAKDVHSIPLHRSAKIDLQVSLDVLRFEADTAGTVTLKSVWRMINPVGSQQMLAKPSTIVQPSGSADIVDVIDAMSEALAALSREIAQTLVDVGKNDSA